MSFNIEWTNADALTPSPFTVTKDGCHFEVKVDAHYVSDEEVETVRRYIDSLHRENAKLREQLEGIVGRSFRTADKMSCLEAENAKLRELLQRLLAEYRYLRVRPRKMYLQHEARMRAIEEEMRELGIEVD